MLSERDKQFLLARHDDGFTQEDAVKALTAKKTQMEQKSKTILQQTKDITSNVEKFKQVETQSPLMANIFKGLMKAEAEKKAPLERRSPTVAGVAEGVMGAGTRGQKEEIEKKILTDKALSRPGTRIEEAIEDTIGKVPYAGGVLEGMLTEQEEQLGFFEKVKAIPSKAMEGAQHGEMMKIDMQQRQKALEAKGEDFGSRLSNIEITDDMNWADKIAAWNAKTMGKVLTKINDLGTKALPYTQPIKEAIYEQFVDPAFTALLEADVIPTGKPGDWFQSLADIGRDVKSITPDVAKEGFGDLATDFGEFVKDNPDIALELERTGATADLARPIVDLLITKGLLKKAPGNTEAIKKTAGEVVEAGKPVVKAGVKLAKEGVEEAGKALTKGYKVLKQKLAKSKNPKADIVKALDARTIEIFEAEKLAKEFGVELPASSFATPLKSKGEQIIGEGLFGGKIKNRAIKAADDFAETVQGIQSKAPKSGELGEDILKQFKSVEAQKKATIKNLYDDVGKLTDESGEALVIETTKSKQVVETLLDRKKTALKTGVGSEADVKLLEGLKKGLARNKDLKTLRATLEEVGEKANFKSFTPTTDEKLYRSLYGALKKDIDGAITTQIPELSEALTKANKAFSEFQTLKERSFVKSIEKLGKAGDVDTIADKLTKTKVSTNEAKQIYETLGEEVTDKIQRKIIADIIEKAKSPTGGFTPTGFSRQLKNIGDETLEALLKPEQVKLLKNLDKVNSLIAKGSSMARGSQTALVQQITGAVKAILATSTGGLSLVGEWILARIINSKKGQVFLKGVDKATIKALEAAAKEAV